MCLFFYSGTTYRFKIRAYSAIDKHSETNWSQPITTDPDNTAALIGIIIPVILITVIVFVVIVARRMMHGTGANSNCMKRLTCLKMKLIDKKMIQVMY